MNKAKYNYYLMEDFELDNNWIKKLERIERKYDLFYKDKQESIDIHSLFIKNNEIIRTSREKMFIEDGKLSRDALIYFIKNNRKLNNVTYKLDSILKFNLTISPEDVVNDYWDNNYLTQERYMSDIEFSDTISVFQDINTLFILFSYPIRSNRNTKKVYITNTYNRKTRRKR
uniref:Uncharacterized protein n=1 Tax=viral metagenome TaxID=1070528 RepID=A0A6C0CNN4_9ZZZZ